MVAMSQIKHKLARKRTRKPVEPLNMERRL